MEIRLNTTGVVVLGVLFCLFLTVHPASATVQKALLIGVGHYKYLPYTSGKGERLDNLRGPANDVQKIRDLLVSGYNFSPENVLVLKDQEATREAIFKHFNQHLVQGTRPGDQVLFYYSGHGTRIPKADYGFYKALCPYDTEMKAKNIQTAKLILNEELEDLFSQLKGREVVVIVDSCHAGGMTRSIRGKPVDQLELTPAIQSKFLPLEIEDVNSAEITRGTGLSIPKQAVGLEDRISILSSREDQISVEMAFPSGVIHGAFTAALLEGIERKRDISYGEWFEQAKKTVKDKFRLEQDPQLKTKKEKMLTQTVFRPTTPAVGTSVMMTQKPKVSTQKALPPSYLEMKEGKILVRLDPVMNLRPGDQENLKQKLRAISYVNLVDTEIFDCLIRGEYKTGQFHLRMVSPTGDAQKISPSGNMDDLIKRMTPYLEYAHLLKKLARINNPDPPFKVQVWMKDKDRRDFTVGEKVQFFVSSDKDCYLIILNLDSQGGMRVLFPNQYFTNNFIKAGRIIKIPDEKMGQKFDLEFGEPVGEEVVKVIATQKPLKLEDVGLAKPAALGKVKPNVGKPNVGKSDVAYFGPKGMIEVPQDTRSIVVKKVELLPSEKVVWSEDTIVIRSHK